MKRELAEKGIIEEVQEILSVTSVLKHKPGRIETPVLRVLCDVFSHSIKEIRDRNGIIKHAAILLSVVRDIDMADTVEPPVERNCFTCRYHDLHVSEFPCSLCDAGGVELSENKATFDQWEGNQEILVKPLFAKICNITGGYSSGRRITFDLWEKPCRKEEE